jgi:hypothetical protein
MVSINTSISTSLIQQLISTSSDELWSDAVTSAGVSSVFRYTYGDSGNIALMFVPCSNIVSQVPCLQTCRNSPAQERGIPRKVNTFRIIKIFF